MRRRHIKDTSKFQVLLLMARGTSIAVIVMLTLLLLDNRDLLFSRSYDDSFVTTLVPIALIIALLVAWINELAGGLLSTAGIAWYYVFFDLFLTGSAANLPLMSALGLPGILFLIYGIRMRFWPCGNPFKKQQMPTDPAPRLRG